MGYPHYVPPKHKVKCPWCPGENPLGTQFCKTCGRQIFFPPMGVKKTGQPGPLPGRLVVPRQSFSSSGYKERKLRKSREVDVVPALSKARDHYKEGDAFEAYVANKLFPEPYFDVIHATTRRSDLAGRKIVSATNPDLHLRDARTGDLFWVECKYRTDASIKDRKLIICKNRSQFDRYKKFQEEHRSERVYIVVGFNGRENAPNDLYCIPLDDLEYSWLFLDKLRTFLRVPDRPFVYSMRRLT